MNTTVTLSKDDIKTLIRSKLSKDYDVSNSDITFSTMNGEFHEAVVKCEPKKVRYTSTQTDSSIVNDR